MAHKLCAVIPVYNHGATVTEVVAQVVARGLPCIVVDDGSNAACAAVLDALAHSGAAHLVRRAVNGGKGSAVMDGLRAATTLGYTHALQVDADGQHNLDDLTRFADTSRRHPEAVVCGAPVYGDDVPRSRLYGRWLTRVWVWINTLSFDIRDAMCGFRVYPLAAIQPIMHGAIVGNRMDFDIEILVRLHWLGIPMQWLPTRIRYPEDGISHFRALRDNVLISRMHALLFAGMLWRLPVLLWRRFGTTGKQA